MLCGVSQTRTKGSQHPKKSFGMSFKKPGEHFLKKTKRKYKKICLRGFRLTIMFFRIPVFALYTVFLCVYF